MDLLRFEAKPFDAVDRSTRASLFQLTNNEKRGDFKDDGEPAGSHFRLLLDDADFGFADTRRWHVVLARHHRSDELVGWALLRPEFVVAARLHIGFYVAPRARRSGAGTRLVFEAAVAAHRLGCTKLVASPWNDASTRFFEAAGFDIVCARCGSVSGLAELDVNDFLFPRKKGSLRETPQLHRHP